MSESPPRVRRAARTYGRRQATSDADTSFEAANTSVETREDSDLSMSTSSYGDPPPDSDDRDAHNASPTSRHGSDASDDEDGNTPAFEFSWKAKLRAIDAGELENNALAGEDETRSASSQITRPTTPNRAASTAFDGSLSSLTASSPPVSQENRPKRPEDLPISDPESDHPKSSPRHPMNTPKSGSSPTPPTSIEAPPMKGKGKQRNVTPLQFSGDEQLPTAPKPSNARRTKQAKGKEVAKRVKPPTKKEQAETRKFAARITADQEVVVGRANEKKFSASEFARKFVHGVSKVPSGSVPRSRSPGGPPTSDPIQAFSSPSHGSESFPIRTSNQERKSTPTRPTFEPTGLLGGPAPVDLASDDDEPDMPDFSEMYKAEQKAKAAAQLKEAKLKMVAHAPTHPDDDDSDLEILDDPKSVAQDEAQARRAEAAHGLLPSRGRKNQLDRAGPSARRESGLPAGDMEDTTRVLQDFARPSFAAAASRKGAASRPSLSRQELGKHLLGMAEKQNDERRRKAEEDYERRGGRMKTRDEDREAAMPLEPRSTLEEIVRQRQAVLNRRAEPQEVHDSDSDHDWEPEQEENGGDDEDARSQAGTASEADDEEDPNPFLAPAKPRTAARTRPANRIESDDEDEENRPSAVLGRNRLIDPSPSAQDTLSLDALMTDSQAQHRGSVSSTGEHTEDGTDKENDVRLSFDRGDDKENTRIAMQSPMSVVSARIGRGLFAAEIEASPSSRTARGTPDGVRSPLKVISTEDDDVFGPPLQLGRADRSVSLEASPMDLGGGLGFDSPIQRSRKGKERAHSTSSSSGGTLDLGGPIGGGGGFSQFFTQEGNARGFDQLKAAQGDDDIDLTQDNGLQPALDVSGSLLRKADEIFQKEQELLAMDEQEESNVQKLKSPEMFINESGFLTQTRPTYDSPLLMKMPSQFAGGLSFSSPSVTSSVRRAPLGVLLTQDPDDVSHPRRLHKRDRSLSPSRAPLNPPKLKNAFDILGKGPSKPKGKLRRSEFVAGEAEESDEEAAFGYAPLRKKDESDEDDDDELDQADLDLVDDNKMDADTLNEDAVLEKVREHEEVDDKAIEQIHLDAIQGKLRAKRRDRGIGFEDSDSEDDDSRRARPSKRPRKDNDNIAALRKNPETKAFAEEYSAQIVDDHNELAFLSKEDESFDIDQGEDEHGQDQDQEEDDDEREVVTTDRLRAELQRAAREAEEVDTPQEVFDPNDVNWLDGDDDDMDVEMGVREVSNEQVGRRRPSTDAILKKGGPAEDPRLARWAKSEASSRTSGIVGRNTGGSAAVTGHAKAKGGGGSFKAARTAASASTASGSSKPKLGKAPSVLSAVSSRRGKFKN